MGKRLLSLLLVVCMFTGALTVTAFAEQAQKYDGAPLVVVSGFATVPLYLNADTPEAEQVFVPSAKRIARNAVQLIPPAVRLRLDGDWNSFADKMDPLLLDTFAQSTMDASGNSIANVSVRKFPLTADHYPEFYLGDGKDENALVRAGVENLGGENTFFFSYDWRLDPLEHAEDLDAFIRDIQKQTGKQKVILAACSMGGAIAMAYLSRYGSKALQTLILDNTAFQGITMVGEMLCLDFAVDRELAIEYLFQFVRMPDAWKTFLKRALNRSAAADRIVQFAGDLLENTKEQTAAEVLYPLFAYMPGIWAFVADREYAQAKKCALDPVVNRALIRKIDAYHYGVQAKAKQILKKASAAGCRIAVLANYGKYAIPLTKSMRVSDDYLIDTALSSGGAVCANVGETLPDDYVQQRDRRHNHLSPDRAIDASTCMFPEWTWFIRDMGHLDFPYGSQGMDFLLWLIGMNKQYTVWTSDRYPQFMQYDVKSKTLTPQ